MSRFFDLFPKVAYDINKDGYTTYQLPTNIFVRVGMIQETIDNISSYYIYDIKESDTPERLADRVYGTSEAHWIIMLANRIRNPSYDWPLNYSDFNNYIANKYRDAAGGNTLTDIQVINWSQTANAGANNIYKYEKVIERTDVAAGQTTEWRYEINYDKGTITLPDVPYDYYLSTNLSPYSTANTDTYTVDGQTVTEKVYKTYQTLYDYEFEQNESKRKIKIIKPEYYVQIMNELKTLVKANNFVRKLTV
jgi:hypothetical protein